LILKAIRHVENYCNISIIYQRIQLTACFVTDWQLPYGPVIGIESVHGSSNDPGSGPLLFNETVDNWRLDGGLYGYGTAYRQRIVYTAGNFLPYDLKQVVLEVISFLYENRGADTSVGAMHEILKNANNYRVLLWI
jgi:hypothetical protein